MNPYIVIIILFIAGGLGTTIWGWTVIARGKRTLKWPATEGVIEKSQPSADGDDLFPHIVFSYAVSGHGVAEDNMGKEVVAVSRGLRFFDNAFRCGPF